MISQSIPSISFYDHAKISMNFCRIEVTVSCSSKVNELPILNSRGSSGVRTLVYNMSLIMEVRFSQSPIALINSFKVIPLFSVLLEEKHSNQEE